MRTINLVLWDNGVGLTRDMRILRELWSTPDSDVFVSAKRRGTLRKWLDPMRLKMRTAFQQMRGYDRSGRFSYNVMLEHVRPEYLALAKRNVLVPNPEWMDETDGQVMDRIDLVLTKTRHAQEIFGGLNCETRYMGFTSEDRLDSAVPRECKFFHLAGRSVLKGTDALLELWQRHPEWPQLTVVQHPKVAKKVGVAANIRHRIEYLSDRDLRRLQNSHAFHLCPSETEGFGHSLVEAMSVGAVTITVDAPPMNEIVGPDRGLPVACARSEKRGLATLYFFDTDAMERAITAAINMDFDERSRIGKAARTWFENNDAEFRARARIVLS